MSIVLILIFGLISGTLMAVLVGVLGSSRRIGFGWAFILSLVFTPLLGLIITLLSSPREGAQRRNIGCLGTILAFLGLVFLVTVVLWILLSIGVLAQATM